MIVAVKDKKTNEVYMACSLCERLCDNDPRDLILDSNITMWKVPNRENTYIGTSNTGFGVDILRTYDLFEGVDKLDSIVIARDIVPKYIDILKTACQLDEEGKPNYATVIVDNGNIYIIERSCTVTMIDDYYAAGYFANVIKGTLYTLRDSDMPIMNKLAEAFHCLDVMKMNGSLPVTVWNTTTDEKTYIMDYRDFGIK